MSTKPQEVELVEKFDLTQPYSFELSQNSKGYFQMKIKVRLDTFDSLDDYKDLKNKFGRAFTNMQMVVKNEGYKIQPEQEPKAFPKPKGKGE